jgi:hypothetical protein
MFRDSIMNVCTRVAAKHLVLFIQLIYSRIRYNVLFYTEVKKYPLNLTISEV